MNHDTENQRLRELIWRRKLTATEEAEQRAFLAANPEAGPDWDVEVALGEALQRLGNVQVPSNFTERVLRAAERETMDPAKAPRWIWSWQAVIPRTAIAVAAVSLGIFAYQRYEVVERTKLARSVAAVLDVETPPSPQFLADFDAIRRLSNTPPPDEELLALLK